VDHRSRPAVVLAALLVLQGVADAAAAYAQTAPPTSSPPAGSSLLNPNISAIGWFQAQAGDQTDEENTTVFQLKEVELGVQAAVDPHSRADIFISFSPDEGVDLEEGYLTLLTLPAGVVAKLGRFRANFGKFNRTHPPETAFADRPLAAERFLGEEGFTETGASISWQIPVGFYLNLDGEVSNTPESFETPSFQYTEGKDLLYLTRLNAYLDLSESSNLTLGTSYANGANGFAQADSTSAPEALRAGLFDVDATFRWKNPRRAIYRSWRVQGEWYRRSAEQLGGPNIDRSGGFAYADYQFSRRWHAGARYDWSDQLDGPAEPPATGVLGFLTFTPSEFSLLSLQVRHQDLEGGVSQMEYFFKTTFNVGPHGQHPF